MRFSLTATALVLAVMLSACGQKGDLYIPDNLAKQEGVAEKSARMPSIPESSARP
ncbi:MAG: lipoprotein [Pseudomonadota bacterium]